MVPMDPVLETFGKTLRRLREQRGLTQGQLAQKISASRNTIGRIERGEHNPTLLLLLDIAEILGVDFNDLVIDCRR